MLPIQVPIQVAVIPLDDFSPVPRTDKVLDPFSPVHAKL